MEKIEIIPLCTGHSCTTLRAKNSLEIALSLTVFEIWTLFHFPRKSKMAAKSGEIANLISKLNFYKLIPYPMDNCFTGQRDRSRQTPEKDVLYRIPAGPVRRVHSPGGASYFLFLSRHCDVMASFSCLVLVIPLVS